MTVRLRRCKRQKGPCWSWRGLVLERPEFWPTALLIWLMKSWSIRGISWLLPLQIRLRVRWKSVLIASIQPLRTVWLRPSTPCVCVFCVVMRIILATIVILQLSILVNNELSWNAFSSSWTWILKNGMNELFWEPFPMLRMIWLMMLPMLLRLAICIRK